MASGARGTLGSRPETLAMSAGWVEQHGSRATIGLVSRDLWLSGVLAYRSTVAFVAELDIFHRSARDVSPPREDDPRGDEAAAIPLCHQADSRQRYLRGRAFLR